MKTTVTSGTLIFSQFHSSIFYMCFSQNPSVGSSNHVTWDLDTIAVTILLGIYYPILAVITKLVPWNPHSSETAYSSRLYDIAIKFYKKSSKSVNISWKCGEISSKSSKKSSKSGKNSSKSAKISSKSVKICSKSDKISSKSCKNIIKIHENSVSKRILVGNTMIFV